MASAYDKSLQIQYQSSNEKKLIPNLQTINHDGDIISSRENSFQKVVVNSYEDEKITQ